MNEEFEEYLSKNGFYSGEYISKFDLWKAAWSLQQAKIDAQQKEMEKYKKGWERYEIARLMNVRMWGDAFELNIKTGKPFDQIIDELKPFLRPGK